jgi:hypothetical protein
MKINDGHYLELLDRLHVIMCNIEEHCIKHPVSKKNKDIRFQLEYALGQLWDAYQQVGGLEDDKNKNTIEKVILRRHKKSKK